MSTFAVTLETLDRVWPHPNADRLELARVKGLAYQFVVGKGDYQAGDPVLYFPIDSVLPPELIATLGLNGKLAGKDKNRIKTVKLRGEISQGVVCRPYEVGVLLAMDASWDEYIGHDYTSYLDVTKYEPPEISVQAGRLVALPDLVGVYDIEGADRYPYVLDVLMPMKVLITEKLEGSHFAASLTPQGIYTICQRRFAIEPDDQAEHNWHKVARESSVRDLLDLLFQYGPGALQRYTVRGEVIGPGVQGNYYDLPHRQLFIFEIERDGQPMAARWAFDFLSFAASRIAGLQTVPLLTSLSEPTTLGRWLQQTCDVRQSHWEDSEVLRAASNGPSALNPAKLREGIVIRPYNSEQHLDGFGRLILKQRSPEYLARSDT